MIKVFIIDDSMLVRNAIGKIIKASPDMELIGEAPNPIDAMEVFKKVGFPDVFVLDIEMPKMDGLTFLRKINEQNPTPVVICSTLVSLGSPEAIDALRLGATDIILKPATDVKGFFSDQKEDLLHAIKAAARSKVFYKPRAIQPASTKEALPSKEGQPSSPFFAIGASTGGVQVIEEIVTNLKVQHLGIVITQHMPEGFTASFAKRLDAISRSKVVEATDGEVICDNKVIIAKGGYHMEVVREAGCFKVKVRDFPRVNSHKPSVNVLFKSIAKLNTQKVIAFLLTGMGEDGASGLKLLHDAGILTYGQAQQDCVVYGMPHAAKLLGAISGELTTREIITLMNQT